MMTITEKVAYLRGLVEGMKLDDSKDEVKVINAIIDTLDDIALSVADLEDEVASVEEIIDEIDEDLDELEETVYEDFGCEGCGDFDDDYDEDELFEVTCPQCSETITVDSQVVEEGSMECPNCGAELEFDIDFDDEEE